MPYKTLKDGRYRVRIESCITVSDQEEAERCDRLLKYAIQEAMAQCRRGVQPCCSVLDKLEEYILFCEKNKRLDPSTVYKYRRDLQRFGETYPKPLDQITVSNIDAYTRDLQVAADYANAILGRIRTFARWCRLRGYVPEGRHLAWVDDMRRLPVKKKSKPVLTMPNLIQSIQRIGEKAEHVAIVLWAMILTGARPKALCMAKWKDVQMPHGDSPGLFTLPILKGGDPATSVIYPGSKLHKLLIRARDIYREKHCKGAGSQGQWLTKKKPVFPSKHGVSKKNPGGWTGSAFSHAVRYYADSVDMNDFVAYTSRHSVMTWLRLNGVDPSQVQRWARHKSVRTQEAYVHTAGIEASEVAKLLEELMDT